MADRECVTDRRIVLTRVKTARKHFEDLVQEGNSVARRTESVSEIFNRDLSRYIHLQREWCVLARGLWAVVIADSDPAKQADIKSMVLPLDSAVTPIEYEALLAMIDQEGATKDQRNKSTKDRRFFKSKADWFFETANDALKSAHNQLAVSRVTLMRLQPPAVVPRLPGALPAGLSAYDQVAPALDIFAPGTEGVGPIDTSILQDYSPEPEDDEDHEMTDAFASMSIADPTSGSTADPGDDTLMTGTGGQPSSGGATGSVPAGSEGSGWTDERPTLPSLNSLDLDSQLSTDVGNRHVSPFRGPAPDADALELAKKFKPF